MGKVVILLLLAGGIFFSACNNAEEKPVDVTSIMKDSTKFTTMQWLDTALDFGTAKRGEKVTLVFHAKNTGDKPLYLYDVRPGCGCTLVDYTKEAIAPGKEGKIMAEYDTNKGSLGAIHKTVYARSNNSNHAQTTLFFSGTVVMGDSTATAKHKS